MAYLRSKSSENRVKAGVGAKTRSAEQFFFIFCVYMQFSVVIGYNMWYNDFTKLKFAQTGKGCTS